MTTRLLTRALTKAITSPLDKRNAVIGSSGSTPLLLDTYTGAAAAYSLRKLRTDYAGSAIRVRRSNDNAEQDIGFSGNDLDTATLNSFTSAANGFHAQWYDQGENSNNVTQATTTDQPQVATSGVAGHPNFDGSTDFLALTDSDFFINGDLTVAAWIKPDVDTFNNAIACCTDGSSIYFIFAYNAGRLAVWQNGDGQTLQSAPLTLAGTRHHVAMTRSGSAGNWTLTIYLNGVNIASTTTATNSDGAGSLLFAIGRCGAFNSWYFDGEIDEVLVYPAALSGADIAAIMAFGE